MRIGVICPIPDIAMLSEYTQFDVALGFMAMRYYDPYVKTLLAQRKLERTVLQIQMPDYIIRDDYYFMAARRISPLYVASTPRNNAQDQLDTYMNFVAAQPGYEELRKTRFLPFVTNTDDLHNLAIYSSTAKRRFVTWDCLDKLPLPKEFLDQSILVGIPSLEALRLIKPYALITAYPIACARVGLTALDENGELRLAINRHITPDWMLAPLANDQLALAIENVKELRHATSHPEG